jgi:tetratricopeptide (TPR) repeat protein
MVPVTDPFSWSYSHHQYIAYHWGFQALLALCDNALGTLGVVWLRTALVVLTAAIMCATFVVRGSNALTALICGLLGLIVVEWRFSVRPELFTNLGLAVTVLLLALRRQGSRVALYLLPVMFVVWVNTHIYILGFIVIGCELMAQFFQRKLDRGLVLATGASIVALYINPYGFDAVMEPIRLFSRLQDTNIFAQHITELASPFTFSDDARQPNSVNVSFVAWLALVSLVPCAGYYLFRAGRLHDLFVLALFSALSSAAIRNLPLFVVAALPALVTGLSLAAANIPERYHEYRRLVTAGLALSILVIAIRVGTGAWYYHHRQPIHLKPVVEHTTLAVEAATFVQEKGLVGKGFNNFNVGGTLMLYAPDHPVYIDGRNEVTGEAFFRRYLEVLEPATFKVFADQAGIQYVVLSHKEMMPLVRTLNASPEWRVVHYDSVAVVFVRAAGPNGHLPGAQLPEPLAYAEMRWAGLHSIMTHPSYVDSFSRWLLGTEELSVEKSQLGVFMLTLGKWKEAEPFLLQAAIESPNFWETANNLGALYTRLKDWEATAFAYRTVLMLNPGDQLARRRANESWSNFVASEKVQP